MAGGWFSVGRSKAKLVAETDIKVTFDDVAGVDEAKAELHEIVDFLKRPEEFSRLGARIPRGILLVGPPGTGKTLLARAVAGEAGVPFFSTNGAEFVEMFVGVGAARVRDLFERAGEVAPAIIFIDELDALGRARTSNPIAGQDEKEQTLNQLLAEMDGFDRSVAIVVLAATNRPEILDPALLRAGRFDRQVLVDRPDRKGRLDILRIHLRALTLAPDVQEADIAALTPGFTGADLANLANEAAVIATRRGAAAISMDDFASAVERLVAGLEKRSRILIPQERRMIAYHEMGHALVAMAIPGTDPVQKVSIIPRGIAGLGYTLQRPTDDRFLMTRHELEDKMAVLLGGRAAEMLVGGDTFTGAADDLAKATDIARGMVLRFGMDDSVGPVAWDTEQGQFLNQQGQFWSAAAVQRGHGARYRPGGTWRAGPRPGAGDRRSCVPTARNWIAGRPRCWRRKRCRATKFRDRKGQGRRPRWPLERLRGPAPLTGRVRVRGRGGSERWHGPQCRPAATRLCPHPSRCRDRSADGRSRPACWHIRLRSSRSPPVRGLFTGRVVRGPPGVCRRRNRTCTERRRH